MSLDQPDKAPSADNDRASESEALDHLALAAQAPVGRGEKSVSTSAVGRGRLPVVITTVFIACSIATIWVVYGLANDPSRTGGYGGAAAGGCPMSPHFCDPSAQPPGGIGEAPPTTVPAGLTPVQLARMRASAMVGYADALEAEETGDLMATQIKLVEMLNSHSRDAWPAGAMARLKDIQSRIGATTQPAGPGHDELALERDVAAKLFEEARKLEQVGDVFAAQDILLKVLNGHVSYAWPEGAVEALRRVQEQIIAANADGPTFFAPKPALPRKQDDNKGEPATAPAN